MRRRQDRSGCPLRELINTPARRARFASNSRRTIALRRNDAMCQIPTSLRWPGAVGPNLIAGSTLSYLPYRGPRRHIVGSISAARSCCGRSGHASSWKRNGRRRRRRIDARSRRPFSSQMFRRAVVGIAIKVAFGVTANPRDRLWIGAGCSVGVLPEPIFVAAPLHLRRRAILGVFRRGGNW